MIPHLHSFCFFLQRGDENNIRSINYYPESASFDLRYYPYYGKLTHVSCILFSFCCQKDLKDKEGLIEIYEY